MIVVITKKELYERFPVDSMAMSEMGMPLFDKIFGAYDIIDDEEELELTEAEWKWLEWHRVSEVKGQ